MKNMHVSNLPEDITKQNICELFGLNPTSYLQETGNIDFPINIKTGKFKGFTFIRALAHITYEFIKIDGIAYHDNQLRVEDATSARKRTNNNTSNESRRPSVVVNNHPENQRVYMEENLQPLKANFQREKKKIWRQHPLWHKIT